MKKNFAALPLSLGLAVLALTVPACAAQDCSDKVLATCTTCHYPTRICEKLGEKNRRDWQMTLQRMLRYGLVLDEAGQDHLLDCLVDLKKDDGKLCR